MSNSHHNSCRNSHDILTGDGHVSDGEEGELHEPHVRGSQQLGGEALRGRGVGWGEG